MRERGEAPTRPWLARPWVRGVAFLFAGGLIYSAAGIFDDAPDGPTIVLSDADVQALEITFAQQTGRAPNAALRRHLIDREIDDRLLVAEARRRGWHRTDPVVQRRLIQNQRFLETDASADDAALLARAYEQGMDETDIVVQRRLRERVRLAVAEASRRDPPSNAELEAFLQANPELFERPARRDLTQIYLSRDRHGDALDAVAREVGEQLRSPGLSPDDAVELGDPSLLPVRVRGTSEDELARRFGHDFARGAFEAEPGAFVGPIASSFGQHFVFVSDARPAVDPPLAEVETEVRSRVEREREQAALLEFTKALRDEAIIIAPGGEAS